MGKCQKMDENDHYENITYMLDENVTIYMWQCVFNSMDLLPLPY
jgi:hypothetical protein